MNSSRGSAVLVVDDEQLVRTYVARVLEGAGYRVAVAADGREALQLIEATPGGFALIVTDERMPQLEGPELTTMVQKRFPDQRFLRIVGEAPDANSQESAWGRLPWIGKPFHPSALVDRVRQLIGDGKVGT